MSRRVKVTPNNFINLDSNLSSCANCAFRKPYQDTCTLFNKSLIRLTQRNGGFHHLRCDNCMDGEVKNDGYIVEKQVERFNNWLPRYLKAKKELEKIAREE